MRTYHSSHTRKQDHMFLVRLLSTAMGLPKKQAMHVNKILEVMECRGMGAASNVSSGGSVATAQASI